MGSFRLVLALSVLASHAISHDVRLISGHSAVQAFFIVSGFYMSLVLRDKYAQAPLNIFYLNRFLRLFPSYLVVLLASVGALLLLDIGIFAGQIQWERMFARDAGVWMPLLFSNLFILGQDILYLLGFAPDGTMLVHGHGVGAVKAWRYLLVPQGWSLSLEILFYALAPLVMRRKTSLVLALFSVSLALRVTLVAQAGESTLFIRRFFPTELSFFLAGALAHRLLEWKRFPVSRLPGAVLAVLLPLLLLTEPLLDTPYFFLLLLPAVALSLPFLFRTFGLSRADRFLGNLSYPFYLSHFLIVAAFAEYAPEADPAFLLGAVLLATFCLYACVDRPVDHWRQARLRNGRSGIVTSAPVAPAPTLLQTGAALAEPMDDLVRKGSDPLVYPAL